MQHAGGPVKRKLVIAVNIVLCHERSLDIVYDQETQPYTEMMQDNMTVWESKRRH